MNNSSFDTNTSDILIWAAKVNILRGNRRFFQKMLFGANTEDTAGIKKCLGDVESRLLALGVKPENF